MKHRLIGLFCALALAAVALAAGCAKLHADSEHALEENPCIIYPTLDQISDFNLMMGSYEQRVAAGDNPKLVFGSSELKSEPVPAYHAARLFRTSDFDFDAMVMGRAFCANLWDAIELGAFADHLNADGSTKVAVFLSTQWFYADGTSSSEKLQYVFSEGAYQALMANDQVSDETKDSIRQQALKYGIPEEKLKGSVSQNDPLKTAVDAVDGTAGEFLDELRSDVHTLGSVANGDNAEGALWEAPNKEASASPVDWDAMFVEARAKSKARSANNDFGYYSDWYESTYKKKHKRSIKDLTLAEGVDPISADEVTDFRLFLDVCKQTGIEPLIVIQPMKAEFYDPTSYDADCRQRYYALVRSVCDEYGVTYADFSSYDDDIYFLRDNTHPSDLGAAHYAKALADWFGEN